MEAQTESRIFDWPGIGAREEAATGQARKEAHALARALAAHSIAVERDAVVQEFDARVQTIMLTIWPDDPIAGYGLHSSLGAFFIAKVAIGMVPSGSHALRHEPLRRDGLFAGLTEHGVDEATALSVLGDWIGVPEGFRGDGEGLSASLLAGVAERTLTRAERNLALCQVAVSPRCLDRLASTCNLLEAVRAVMPVLPPESLGPKLASAVAAHALGRPDRVVELFGDRADDLALRTVTELAAVQWSLGRVESPMLGEDEDILSVPMEGDGSEDEEATHVGPIPDGSDEDDVLEIVEERVDPSYLPAQDAAEPRTPRPPRWSELRPEIGEDALIAWASGRRAAQDVVGHAGRILGLDVRALNLTVPPIPIPPDERLIESPRGDPSFSPLFPPVRGMLRAIMAAADGRAPSEAAIKEAGDLTWAVRRARALAMIVRGDLPEARKAVEGMPPESAPEGRWAEDRLLRYEGRAQVPVSIEEARPAAAALVADLASQLARTVAGSLGLDRGAQG